MDGLTLLLVGTIIGMLVMAVLRPPSLFVPPIVVPSERNGCFGAIVAFFFLVLGLLLLLGRSPW